jgi:hypothetical protein
MLLQLLQLLQAGKVHSPGELALELGIRVEMVNELLQQLQRLGYLALQDTSCASGGCSHCDVRGSCQTSAKIWSLTAKGLRAGSAHS